MIPALAVGLGLALAWALGRARESGRSWTALFAGCALVSGVAPPVVTALRFDHLMAQPDTRDLASRWLVQHQSDAGAVSEGWWAQTQILDRDSAQRCNEKLPEWLRSQVPVLPRGPFGWRDAIERGPRGWGSIAFGATQNYIWVTPARYRAEYLVSGQLYLPCGKVGRIQDNGPPSPCYRLVDVIDPGRLSCSSKMDLFDAFFVPFTGFEGQTLPGPRIEIYENLCLMGPL